MSNNPKNIKEENNDTTTIKEEDSHDTTIKKEEDHQDTMMKEEDIEEEENSSDSSGSSKEEDSYDLSERNGYDDDSLPNSGTSSMMDYVYTVRQVRAKTLIVEETLEDMKASNNPKSIVKEIYDNQDDSAEDAYNFEALCNMDILDKGMEMDWKIIEYFHDGNYTENELLLCFGLSRGELFKYLEDGDLWSMREIKTIKRMVMKYCL